MRLALLLSSALLLAGLSVTCAHADSQLSPSAAPTASSAAPVIVAPAATSAAMAEMTQGSCVHWGDGYPALVNGICQTYILRQLDSDLADALKQEFARTADKQKVIDEQTRWLEVRDACADGSCIAKAYQTRLQQVRADLFSTSQKGDPANQEMARHARPLQGATPHERVAFLMKIMSARHTRSKDDVSKDIPYILGALTDPSPTVRGRGTFWLIDASLIPPFIHIMATDPEPKVRTSAAMAISRFTDDHAADCKYVDADSLEAISAHLDEFLGGLKDSESSFAGANESTSRYVSAVLGGRGDGDLALACCMTQGDRQHVIKALEALDAEEAPGAAPDPLLQKIRGCPAGPGKEEKGI